MLHIPVAELQRLTDAVMAINRTGTASDAIVAMLDAARSLLGAPQAAVVLAPGIVGPHADGALTISSPIGATTRDGAPLGPCASPLVDAAGVVLGSLHVDHEPTLQAQSLVDFLAALFSNLLESRRLADEAAWQSARADEEHRHLRDLLDTVPSGILAVDGRGSAVYQNEAAITALVPLIEDLATTSDVPSERMRNVDGTARPWDETALMRATRGETVRGDVLGVVDGAGTTTWFVSNASPTLDAGGRPNGAVTGFLDVSEQVELQRRLTASEARLRASERVAHVGSFELDAVTLDSTWSVGAYELLGLDLSTELSSTTYLEMVHPEDRDRLLAAVQVTISRAAPLSLRHRVTRRDGRSRTLAGLGEPVVNAAGEVERVVGTVRDITDEAAEHERLRRAQQLESVGRLAGGLAHDLNNFLTVLAGHAELLAVSASAEQSGHIAAIVRATDRAAILTRQLLEVGRREILQPQVLDVNEIVTGQQVIYRRVLPRTVEFRCELADDLAAVSFDLTKLEQVLLNLVLNASDAVGVSGTVTISTRQVVLDTEEAGQHELRPGAYVAIVVRDDGTGMAPGVLARAFEPFFTTKGGEHGSGLGLSTSYGIMRQSDGQIVVESEAGRGTTVTLLLPTTDRVRVATPPREPRPARPLAGTVLVVEDDEQVRQLAVDSLRRAGCRVLEAFDGPDGLKVARHHPGAIDVLVTDVSMPGFGGRRLAQHLTDERQGMAVLYMSGYMEDSVVLRGIVESGIEFLPKPFVVSDLLARVGALLSSREPPPL